MKILTQANVQWIQCQKSFLCALFKETKYRNAFKMKPYREILSLIFLISKRQLKPYINYLGISPACVCEKCNKLISKFHSISKYFLFDNYFYFILILKCKLFWKSSRKFCLRYEYPAYIVTNKYQIIFNFCSFNCRYYIIILNFIAWNLK